MAKELWVVGVYPDAHTVAVKSAVRCAGVRYDFMENRKQPFVVLGVYRTAEDAEKNRDRLQEWYNPTERVKAADEPLKARGGVSVAMVCEDMRKRKSAEEWR